MDSKILECLRRGNPVVFFDISVGGTPSGRIRLELFKDKCPKVFLFLSLNNNIDCGEFQVFRYYEIF